MAGSGDFRGDPEERGGDEVENLGGEGCDSSRGERTEVASCRLSPTGGISPSGDGNSCEKLSSVDWCG